MSQRQRLSSVFAIGTFLALAGLAGFLIGLRGVFRTASGILLVVGGLMHYGAYFPLAWDQNTAVRRINGSRNGRLWLRILAAVLWLAVLPIACLWVYNYLNQH